MGAAVSAYFTREVDISKGFVDNYMDTSSSSDENKSRLWFFIRKSKTIELTIHQAAANGDYHRVHICLKKGADPNATEAFNSPHDPYNRQDTPLLCAIRGNQRGGGTSRHVRICKLLVEQWGGDITKTNRLEQSPLQIACQKDHIKIAQWLILKHGASVNVSDKVGTTPLQCACENKSIPMIKLMLEQHVQVYTPASTFIHSNVRMQKHNITSMLDFLKEFPDIQQQLIDLEQHQCQDRAMEDLERRRRHLISNSDGDEHRHTKDPTPDHHQAQVKIKNKKSHRQNQLLMRRRIQDDRMKAQIALRMEKYMAYEATRAQQRALQRCFSNGQWVKALNKGHWHYRLSDAAASSSHSNATGGHRLVDESQALIRELAHRNQRHAHLRDIQTALDESFESYLAKARAFHSMEEFQLTQTFRPRTVPSVFPDPLTQAPVTPQLQEVVVAKVRKRKGKVRDPGSTTLSTRTNQCDA